MQILILGGGGREHALGWAIAQNPKCDRLWCAPGNAGIRAIAHLAEIDILDGAAVRDFCVEKSIGLVVIGPEAPLVAGVADILRAAGIPTLGPSAAAARLEASKSFTKEICLACGAPTASASSFTDQTAALADLQGRRLPVVVKADGLAAGKGVTVAETLAEAEAAVLAICQDPGARVLIEDFMVGEEASFFVLTDGETILPLGTAQDHKRAFDGDLGPNTGGMGAYSPAPVMTEAVCTRALDEIIRPTLAEMARRGTPFQGILYAGLMIADGVPRLVEWNVRFGDPEAQVIAMRLGAQLLDVFLAAASGELAQTRLNWGTDHALSVVLAARGYPGKFSRGDPLGLPDEIDPRVQIFHAGTRMEGKTPVSNGGRVLAVTARGPDLRTARDLAYATVDRIDWPGAHLRRDIGWRGLPPAQA